MNTIKKYFYSHRYFLLGAFVSLVTLTAKIGVGTASSWRNYQPQLPKGIER